MTVRRAISVEELSALPDALLGLLCLAVDHTGLGGAVLHTGDTSLAQRWVKWLQVLLPEATPVNRLPVHAGPDRIIGGLDMAASLARGETVSERGLLERSDGGLVVIPTAERLEPGKAALLGMTLDTHSVAIQRDGLDLVRSARIAVLAIDGAQSDDEGVPLLLRERLAFEINIDHHASAPTFTAADMQAARVRYASARLPAEIVTALAETAVALGVPSLRAGIHAARVARALAAFGHAKEAGMAHAALAARLVLAHRATRYPAPPEPEEEQQQDAPQPPDDSGGENDSPSTGEMPDIVLDAVMPALPRHLIEQIEAGALLQRQSRSGSGATAKRSAKLRGRPAGSRAGQLEDGARLNLIDTIRAAAPWQKLRTRMNPARRGLHVSEDDFRISRFKPRQETTVIFVVDASGSAAAQRLAEAKGAVELLLADCYVRRDRIALIAFRGKLAEVLLPPTRSLQRAKRALAGLPGGGGTPLTQAILQAAVVADQVKRGGGTPLLVFLTDGRANITRDGVADRTAAVKESLQAAGALRVQGYRSMVLDVSANPQAAAKALATAMASVYLPLPYARANTISQSVAQLMPTGG